MRGNSLRLIHLLERRDAPIGTDEHQHPAVPRATQR